MHVLIATDGSEQSLEAARFLESVVDPAKVTKVTVLAVVSPLAAVPFASDAEKGREPIEEMSFRRTAERATEHVAVELRRWAPEVATSVVGGSPSGEIVKAAVREQAGLIVVASRSSRTEAVLMGSVAHRVLNHADCPVLVWRTPAKPRR
ncbi:MAG: universal stress protein [Nocardioidaceae bacterium]|nr:universal stress protein [Nocardioidaceae bacterium]